MIAKWPSSVKVRERVDSRKRPRFELPHFIPASVFAGSIAGICNQTVCHPFDTVRTRLQMMPHLRGPIQCAKIMISREGVLAFYKGFSTPLAAQAVYKSVLFTVNANAKKNLGFLENNPNAKVLACGFLSGSVNSLVVTPVELVRNQLMMQTDPVKVRFTGPRGIVKYVLSQSATPFEFVRKMYRGWSATVTRDSLGVALWFWGFDISQRFVKRLSNDDELRISQLLLCGSFSGILFWAIALPFDNLKSRIQCAPLEDLSIPMFSLVRDINFVNLKRLYRGYQVAFGRGLPGAAITLTVHHFVIQRVE